MSGQYISGAGFALENEGLTPLAHVRIVMPYLVSRPPWRLTIQVSVVMRSAGLKHGLITPCKIVVPGVALSCCAVR